MKMTHASSFSEYSGMGYNGIYQEKLNSIALKGINFEKVVICFNSLQCNILPNNRLGLPFIYFNHDNINIGLCLRPIKL